MSVVDTRQNGIEKCEKKIARYEIYLKAAREELEKRQNSLQKEINRTKNPPPKKEKSSLMRVDTILRLTPEKIASHQYLDKIQRNTEYFLEHSLGIKDKVENVEERTNLEERIKKFQEILREIKKVKEEKHYGEDQDSGDQNSENNSKESDE